jgi:hypothetical protein
MRQALRQNRARAQTAIARSIPAPVGGWDTESPLAAMPPKNALILDNWIPRAASCELRRGFVQQVTGTDDAVEAMIAWRGDPSGDKLLACAGANIYDVTQATALGSALYGSAGSARWQSANFANDAGAFAIAVNGFNIPQGFNGTAFSDLSITAEQGAVTADPTDFSHVMVHKRRLWFIEQDTLHAWFLETNAIQGPAQLLDMGPLFYKGGRLVAMGAWSLDGGAGMDDVAVFVTNEGQVAIWQGLDPTDPDNWSLVGVFDLARPLGLQSLVKYGADLVLLSEDGVITLSQALNKDRAQDDRVALTAQIGTAFSKAAVEGRDLHGWSGLLYPGNGSLAIFNVPIAELETSHQYVQSMQTGAWCRFTGINAFCWALANGKIYFGGTDGVYRWDVGGSDDGEVISGDVKPAFNAFGNRATLKRFTMARALLKCAAIVRPALEVLTDYREATPVATPTVVSAGDVSAADADTIRNDWTSVSGIGYVGSPRMHVALIGDTETSRIDYGAGLLLTEPGTDGLLTRPSLPLEVPVQLIGFDVMFQGGGQL